MLFLVVCLGFLILGVCYYSVKEVHLQERQAKTVYERTILLSAINSTKKKVEEGLAGKEEEEVRKEGVESHQETTISSSSFGSTTNSSTVNSNTFVTTTLSNSSTPDLPPLPPTPPPEMDSSEKLMMTMRRIPLEAVLVNGKGGSINGGVTVSSVKKVNSSGPTGGDELPRTHLVLQSFSSAV